MNVSECQQQQSQSNNFQENNHHIESNNECNNLQERRQQPKRERRLPKRYADNVELNLYSNSNCRSAHVKQEKEESEFIEQIQSEPIAALRTFDGISLAEIYEIDQASPSPTPCSPPSNATTTTTAAAFSLKPKIRFICEFCNKAFTKQSEFLKHVQIHRNCGLECAECLALFRNHQQLEQHQCQLQHQGFTEIEYCSFERSPSAVEAPPATATTTTAAAGAGAAAINIIVGQNGQIQSIDSTANDASNDSNNTKDDDDSSQLPPVASEASPLAAASGGTTNESIITNLKFTCLKCYKEFDCHAAVRRHNKQTHTEERNYKCQECSATFKHKSNFDYHMAKHTNNKPFKCEHCVKAFAVNYELVMHMRTHTGEQPYNCDICGKPFRHRCNLIVHQRLHSGIKPYKCDICDANFNSSSHLKKHKEYHLSEAQKEADMRYKKEHIIKPKLVDAKEFFRIHYETADATEPPTSNGKPLIQIGKNAAQPSKPARAIQPEPPKQQQQPCQAIPKSPNDTKNALNNKLSPGKAAQKKIPAAADDMGVDTVDAQLEAQPTTTNEFNLIYKCQCSICFRYFKQRSALTRHLRTHTGERPYNCAWCAKSFADPSNFKKHKMAHIRDELIGVGGSGDGDGGGDKKKGKATPVEDSDEQFENAQFVYAKEPAQRQPTAVATTATTNDDTDCEIDDDNLDDFTTSKGPLIIWPDFKSNELQPSTLSEIEANTQSLLKYGFLEQQQLNKELDRAAADAAIDNEQQHLQLLTISYHDDLD